MDRFTKTSILILVILGICSSISKCTASQEAENPTEQISLVSECQCHMCHNCTD